MKKSKNVLLIAVIALFLMVSPLSANTENEESVSQDETTNETVVENENTEEENQEVEIAPETEVGVAIPKKAKQETTKDMTRTTTLPATAAELFPDKVVQKTVLDQLYIYDETQPLTQANLDSIYGLYGLTDVTSFENFSLMRNLMSLSVESGTVSDFTQLKDLDFWELKLDNIGLNTLEPFKDMQNLQTFSAIGANISDYSSLTSFNGIQNLNLTKSNFSDISILSSPALNNIRELNLADTAITSTSGLLNMTNLNVLNLKNTAIADLTGLVNMNPIELEISNTGISSLAEISHFTKLYYFRATNNEINDLTPIQNCSYITEVDVRNNKITSLIFAVNMPYLSYLRADNNQITGLGMGGINLKVSQDLTLSNNPLQDLDFLTSLGSINTLDLSNCEIDNTILSTLPSLTIYDTLNLSNNDFSDVSLINNALLATNTKVDLSDTQVTDLSGLNVNAAIGGLFLRNLNISDYTPLNGLSNLQTLEIINNPQGNFSSLNLPYLETLTIQNSNLSSLNFLNNSPMIRNLFLTNNKIENLSPLQTLYDLQTLDLTNNKVTSIESIQSLNVRNLTLDGNHISDIAYLSELGRMSVYTSILNQVIDLDEVEYENTFVTPLAFLFDDGALESISVTFPNGDGTYNATTKEITWTNVQPNTILEYFVDAKFNADGIGEIGQNGIVSYTGTYYLPVADGDVTTYTVTFNSNGGTDVAPITGINSGEHIQEPAVTKENHEFKGWYLDNTTFLNAWDFDNDTVTSNVTLHAKWEKNTDIPEEKEKPSEKGKPSTKVTTKDSQAPKTGDNTTLIKYFIILLCGITGAYFIINKHSSEKK